MGSSELVKHLEDLNRQFNDFNTIYRGKTRFQWQLGPFGLGCCGIFMESFREDIKWTGRQMEGGREIGIKEGFECTNNCEFTRSSISSSNAK